MTCRPLILIAALLTLACNNDLLTPYPREARLDGLWGGAEMEFTANAFGLVMQTACEREQFLGPVIPDASGSFSAVGTMLGYYGGLNTQTIPARITGVISSDSIQLVLEVQAPQNGTWVKWGTYENQDGVLVRTSTFRLTAGKNATHPYVAGCLA